MSHPSRRLALVAAAVACCASALTATVGSEAFGRAESGSQEAHDAATAPTKAAPPVPLPAHPHGLPAPAELGNDVDETPSYQPQLSCAVRALPGTLKLRKLALATYGRGGTSPATPRSCSTGSASEHKDGRAWDWMLSHSNRADRKAAADFLSWLIRRGPAGEPGEMASRLGVQYVIYNRKIWAAYSPGWRDYTGSDPHTSHIHISLTWNGARGHTSFWTGRTWDTDYGVCQVFAGQPALAATRRARTKPCPAPVNAPLGSSRPLAWMGNTGDAVSDGQRLLGLTASGTFNRATRAAALDYQRAHDLPRTGCLDKQTWASLEPATAVRGVPNWNPAKAAAWARANGSPTIHRGDAGKLTYALQVALRMPGDQRNGYFGAATSAAVVAVKVDAGLPATPLVNAEVWELLPTPA